MNRRGMTLVEVMMAATILFIAGGAICVLAQIGNRLWGSTASRLDSIASAQRALNRMTDDLHQASLASFSPPSCQLPFSFTINNGNKITYSLASQALMRKEEAGAVTLFDQSLATGLEAFTVSCGGGLVNFNVTLSNVRYPDASRQALTSQVFVQTP